MRVVFDTNIFVSALVFPGSAASRALDRVVDRRDTLVVSKPIIDETIGILGRKFGRHDEELARTALFIADIGDVVSPDLTLTVLADEPDNRILECAVAGAATLVVTGDKKMLALGTYREVRISTLANYADSDDTEVAPTAS